MIIGYNAVGRMTKNKNLEQVTVADFDIDKMWELIMEINKVHKEKWTEINLKMFRRKEKIEKGRGIVNVGLIFS